MSKLAFDWNETLKVANFVGFNPETNEDDRQEVILVKQHWKITDDLTKDEREKAYFYLTLGGVVYDKYGDNPPDEIYDWYAFNTACCTFDRFSQHGLDEAVNDYDNCSKLAA